LPSNVNYYERNYVYDKLGNIESVVQTGTNGFTRDYTYNSGKNTLQKIEDATPTTIESYTYDDCGNTLTTNLNRYYTWNYADQLLCYKNQAGMSDPTVFTQYDYSGHDRVSKLVRTGTAMSPVYERTIYIDGIFEYVKLENGTTYEKNYIHIMDDKSRIAEVRINPGTAFPGDIIDDVVYILEDQIGSSVVRLNITGTIIDEEEYYPFGDSSLRTFTYKRYRYVGKEKDAESGLYYYGARYYAAWTCRFISVDPLAEKYVHLTPYNYAANKPIDDYDIDGMQSTGEPQSGGTKTIDAPNPLGNEGHMKAADGTDVTLSTDEIRVTPNESGWAKAWDITKSFFKGVAKGLVTGIVVAGAIALAAAVAPLAGIIVGAVALGVGIYSGIQIGKSWIKGEYNTNQKAEIVGEVIGGLIGGRIGAKGGTKLGEKILKKNKSNSELNSEISKNPKSLSDVNITKEGISDVKNHLDTFNSNAKKGSWDHNNIMLDRLNKIANGEMEATETDLLFYSHEIAEAGYMKEGLSYGDAHVRALEDYGLDISQASQDRLYTPEALEAFRNQLFNE
jgi:RHS repeat-associated protein